MKDRKITKEIKRMLKFAVKRGEVILKLITLIKTTIDN